MHVCMVWTSRPLATMGPSCLGGGHAGPHSLQLSVTNQLLQGALAAKRHWCGSGAWAQEEEEMFMMRRVFSFSTGDII